MARSRLAGRKVLKLTALAAVPAVAIVAAWSALEQAPKLAVARASIAFLVALEAAYGVALVGCLAGIPTLLTLLLRARRRRVRRPWVARGLLACVSVLLGLATSELAAARLARGVRGPAVPVGGALAGSPAPRAARLPGPSAEVRLPDDFPGPKGGDEVDLVVLGESSAAGVPYSLFNLSMGTILASSLKEAIPGKRFRLVQLAESGDTLEGQHGKLAGLSRRPDLVLVYCGHNEFSARLPAGRELDHYADARAPTPWESLVGLAERASPLCGLIRSTADRRRVAIPPPAHGTRSLVDVPAYSPAEFDALLADFRRRLEAIVGFAERSGAIVVLVAPAANDSDFEPNRSVLPAETTRAGRDAFARDFAAARSLETSDPDEAARRYRSLLARAPDFAETHYRLARLLERSGLVEEAYRHDVAARDRDGFPMRCPTAFQDAYREIAARRGCLLVDGQAYFHAIGRRGLLDDHLFHDGMHPSLRGQSALALAVLRALHARRAFGWPEGSPGPYLDPKSVATRFGLKPWSWGKLCHWGIMFYDSTAPARFDPAVRRAKQDAFGKAADRIDRGTAPESVGLPNIGVPAPAPPFAEPGPPIEKAAHRPWPVDGPEDVGHRRSWPGRTGLELIGNPVPRLARRPMTPTRVEGPK